jgi:hypothetical protein
VKKYLVVLAVAAIAVFAVVATSGAQAPGPQTLVLKENSKGGKFTFVDAARPFAKNPKRPTPSQGDYFVFYSPLNDAAGNPAGELDVKCTIIKKGKARTGQGEVDLCNGVVGLSNGEIFVAARTTGGNNPDVRGAITGGTGAYANARGTLTSVGENNSIDTLVFTTS